MSLYVGKLIMVNLPGSGQLPASKLYYDYTESERLGVFRSLSPYALNSWKVWILMVKPLTFGAGGAYRSFYTEPWVNYYSEFMSLLTMAKRGQ